MRPADRPPPEHAVLTRCLPASAVENGVQAVLPLQLVEQQAIVDMTVSTTIGPDKPHLELLAAVGDFGQESATGSSSAANRSIRQI